MSAVNSEITTILEKQNAVDLKVNTLGLFQVEQQGAVIADGDWKRDIAIQLFQFFVTYRNQMALHKTKIIYRLWGDISEDAGNRNFKAALHNISKVIEPEKPSRSPSSFLIRQGMTYRLDTSKIWIDIDALDALIVVGNQLLPKDAQTATLAYEQAVTLYQGVYLPDRIFDDWCAEERERIQVLILGAMMSLAKLKLKEHPQESIRLAQQALLIDATWEEAYRLQMHAYMEDGNRPLALKTYKKCQAILLEEFEIEPLPETKALFKQISGLN